MSGAETRRLEADARREANWKRWGPYLSARQWGTVREDYSEHGTSWDYFPHDHARSRAYRWGEDGLLGITDRECRLCFALALWNGKDPILKERLFGLTALEGNHGEDVKEEYFYLDSTPTHSYLKALYKYPQAEFPYARLVEENRRRSRNEPEFELRDTGIFDEDRYFDVFAEYAKNSPDDILIRITAINRGPETAPLHLLPTLWYRNTWSWGCSHEGCALKPRIGREKDENLIATSHETLGNFRLAIGPDPAGGQPPVLFTENETNTFRLWGAESGPFAKDAFHEYLVRGRPEAVNTKGIGTKAAAHYTLQIPGRGSQTICLRLFNEAESPERPIGSDFAEIFSARIREADEFYGAVVPHQLNDAELRVVRQGYAGLFWSKQFYHYIVRDWLEGDPGMPPPESRQQGRNRDWTHLYSRDVISMPDKWEYPWFAAWDLAFHLIPLARLDPAFAKDQLLLFLREWYLHPNGQLPAYEFAFGDVNPPVHAWAAWRVYKISARVGERDRDFLESVFQKLLLNRWAAGLERAAHCAATQGCARPEFVLRRVPRPGQRRRVRPLEAAAHRRHVAAGRRHGLDGVLLRHDAEHGARTGARPRQGPHRLRRHGVEVSRTLRPNCRCHEHARRHRPLGRRRRVLLRPDRDRSHGGPPEDPFDGRLAAPDCRGSSR